MSLQDFAVPSPTPGFDSQPAESIAILGSTDLKQSLNHKDADGMLDNAGDDNAPKTPRSSSPLSSPVYTPEHAPPSPIGELHYHFCLFTFF